MKQPRGELIADDSNPCNPVRHGNSGRNPIKMAVYYDMRFLWNLFPRDKKERGCEGADDKGLLLS